MVADYYVATTGSDSAGDGTELKPWATLSHACSVVTTPGKTIYVAAGNYVETTMISFSPGVSAFGAGDSTNIQCAYQDNGDQRNIWLNFVSNSEGVDGNQSLSHMKFDGMNLRARHAGYVRGRSNVRIHHCTFKDFYYDGFTFSGLATEVDGEPAIYASGNEFHHNTITNSSIYSGYGHGGLQLGGQKGMLVYDNSISQTSRASGQNGYCIKAYRGGYLKGCKIYNNNILRNSQGCEFNFAVELWNFEGLEVHNNKIVGNSDLAGGRRGAYAFSVDFHHNEVGPASVQAWAENGVELEIQAYGATSDAIIRNNRFKNLFAALKVYKASGGLFFNNVHFFNNVMYLSRGLETAAADSSGGYSNWSIWNNTVYADGTVGNGWTAYRVPGDGAASGFSIRNNIAVGCYNSPVFMGQDRPGGTIDNVSIENNLFFNCGNSNAVKISTIAPTNVKNVNNIVGDPLFVSTRAASPDFHLRLGSPAIDAGLNVGLTTDCDDWARTLPIDIGAYEFH